MRYAVSSLLLIVVLPLTAPARDNPCSLEECTITDCAGNASTYTQLIEVRQDIPLELILTTGGQCARPLRRNARIERTESRPTSSLGATQGRAARWRVCDCHDRTRLKYSDRELVLR